MRAHSLSLCLFASLFLCFSRAAYADTTWVVGGDVSGLWQSDHSPYMIQGTIHVPMGEMLSIGPGVRVFFTGPYPLYADSASRLEAIGAEGDSIYFTTDTLANPQKWAGIRLRYLADTCRFEWCVVANYHENDGAITEYSTPLLIRHSTFRDNRGSEGGAIQLAGGMVQLDTTYFEITQSLFESNQAAFGFAIELMYSKGKIEDCEFHNNSTIPFIDPFGFGAIDFYMGVGPTTVRNCTFVSNHGRYGGAVMVEMTDTALVFENCRFSSNEAIYGGAVSSNVIHGFRQCFFDSNRASGRGGAVLFTGGVVDQCVFTNNVADTNGGAIWAGPLASIRRSTFYHNQSQLNGAALYLHDWADVEACTFVRCTGGNAIHVPAGGNPPGTRAFQYNLMFLNPLGDFSSNTAGLGNICCANRNGDSCDLYDNLFFDPQFVDTAAGDYHLLAFSPCIDAGPDSSAQFPVHDPDGTIADIGAYYYDQTQAVDPERTAVRRYELMQNYPNPFNATTEIRFDLPKAAQVNLAVYDLLGRQVAVLSNERLSAGTHSISFNGGDLPSGIYFYRLQAAQAVQTRKMILLK